MVRQKPPDRRPGLCYIRREFAAAGKEWEKGMANMMEVGLGGKDGLGKMARLGLPCGGRSFIIEGRCVGRPYGLPSGWKVPRCNAY